GPGDVEPKGRRVLLIDDSAVALKSTATILQMSGYRVATACDGESAIKAAREFKPENILLDLRLPDMDGYEVFEHLKQLDDMENTTFIAVTGFGDEERKRAEEAGFDHYVTKPINLAELEKLLLDRTPEAVAPRGND
ncbi:MAG: response regulator, partial [Deltaproteobacteria bacterium]|nr:response regulator [Deltaproteobacteria bacterium]